ncbi:multidrug ABC transporter ATP-binding protein [Enterococcus ureilyticus]|uniref:Multidrug ABC transporter ATP-binding protein n=1 Tax=Enterococcus ureilyticus TaxID=1131292 RepID=A0A1E5H5I4_9ENTE|nr:ABC transporter ATP-binding protein [Enterococcus ureilyticus]MBM7688969.1 ATP-binding cassette subfamily B protein [Enterococcus ureilyticus]OEG20227.1 multidrug ABC transporter ATP-binding protein [Enterococcus ureilyticus]
MKIIQFFIKKNRKLIFVTVISLCLQIIGTLGVPMLVAQLIDVGIASGDKQSIKTIGLQMLAMALFGALAAILGSYLSAKVAAKFGFETRTLFFDKLQTFSIKDADRFGTGSLLTRMTNDVDNIQQMIVLFLQLILPAPIIAIFSLYMTFTYSATLALVPLIAIAAFALIVYILMKKGTPLSLLIQPKMDKIIVTLREFFTGINMIRAFNNQDYEEERTNKTFSDYANGMIRVNRIFAFITPVAFLLMGIVFSSILWFGGNLVALGTLQIGTVSAVVEYSLLTLSYLMIAAMVLVMVPRSFASVKRIEEILNTQDEISDPKQSATLNASGCENALIDLTHVTFSYDQADEPVLEDIHFSIPKGKITAIVGGTGSGKSTVAKLLLRLSDVSEGAILFDGVDIRNVTQEELRSKISYVPQKAFLFSGTIKSNLLMGYTEATKTDMDRAATIAQLSSYLTTLENGYESFVAQGGTNFSGGQRQRLCIARALIKPADIYIFDDSFSALDYQTDAALRLALKEEMSDKTLLIVAQRLSTIQQADSIIVLDEGKIVGQGTHSQLLQNNQTYQEFARSQGMLTKGAQA